MILLQIGSEFMNVSNFINPIFLLEFLWCLDHHPQLIILIEERDEQYCFPCIMVYQCEAVSFTDSE